MRVSRSALTLSWLLVVASCGGSAPSAPPVATTVTISAPGSTTLTSGSTLALQAVVRSQAGDVMQGQAVSWRSSDDTHATVSSAGVVTARLAGPVTITATSGSASGTIALTIAPGPPSLVVRGRDVSPGVVVGTVDSISAIVTDAGGNPIAGVSVSFSVLTGGGSITLVATTGANGVATARWTLGTTAGTQTVQATAAGVPGSLTFSASTVAAAAATITKVGTDPVNASAGAVIDSIKVRVADQFGNPRAGETVVFAVVNGGGTVSPTQVVTGIDGMAAARWTLGTAPNTLNTATATRAGLAAPAITFNTTTTATVAITGIAISGPRFVVLDSLASLPVTVTATSAGGTIQNPPVTVVARSAAVSVSGTTITGRQRGSTFVVVSSTQSPALTDSMLVTVALPGAPVVLTDLARFDLKHDTTLTISVIVNMRGANALGALTMQVTWPPSVLTYVSDASGSSGVTASVNGTDAPSGVLTLSLANAAGLSGAVTVRQIVFKAASAVGQAGTLSLLVSELVTANTFLDLRRSTVSVSTPLIIR